MSRLPPNPRRPDEMKPKISTDEQVDPLDLYRSNSIMLSVRRISYEPNDKHTKYYPYYQMLIEMHEVTKAAVGGGLTPKKTLQRFTNNLLKLMVNNTLGYIHWDAFKETAFGPTTKDETIWYLSEKVENGKDHDLGLWKMVAGPEIDDWEETYSGNSLTPLRGFIDFWWPYYSKKELKQMKKENNGKKTLT